MSIWASLRKKREPDPAQGRGGATERLELGLLAGVKRGRRADFDALYRLCHPLRWWFLSELMRRPDAIEQALNDTLPVVWRRVDSFDGCSKLSMRIFGIACRTD